MLRAKAEKKETTIEYRLPSGKNSQQLSRIMLKEMFDFILYFSLANCFGRGEQTFVVCLKKGRNCLTYKMFEEKMEVVCNGQCHDNRWET